LCPVSLDVSTWNYGWLFLFFSAFFTFFTFFAFYTFLCRFIPLFVLFLVLSFFFVLSLFSGYILTITR
jgi:hypothetical protein